MRRTRVLLADDNVSVRHGLKHLIDQQPDMEVVAETGDGEDALQLAHRLLPDVALVDVSMPGWDGVKLTREMSLAQPSVKIIAVTRHDDGGFVKKMMEAGACGYVLKQTATSTLAPAVRACVGGSVFIDPGLKSFPSGGAAAAPISVPLAHEPLTAAEEQVLRLFGSAASTQSIADELGLSRDDVARIKHAAMQKLGFTTRQQAMHYARSHPPA